MSEIKSKAGIHFLFPNIFGASLFTIAYLGMMIWFAYTDVWHTKFDLPGWHYSVYNIVRFSFIFFFIFILCGTGKILKIIIIKNNIFLALSMMEQFVVDFFLGAATWIILMYFLGIIGAYFYLPILLLTSIPIFVFYDTLKETTLKITKDLNNYSILESPLHSASIIFSFTAIALLLIELIINGGLSVNNFGYDSSHYLAYYDQVVHHHGTAPNELWYHFWTTKGAGLHFLSVLLLDIHSPQLVSTSFLLMTSLTLVIFSRRINEHGLILGLLIAVLFLTAFLASDMTNILHQKLHIITAGLMTGIIWMSVIANKLPISSRRSWLLLVGIVAGSAVLHTPPLGALLILWFGFSSLFEFIQNFKHGKSFVVNALPLTFVTVCLVLALIVNYLWTGMAEITPFRLFFSYANQSKLSGYVSPYILLLLSEWVPKNIGYFDIRDLFYAKINFPYFLYMSYLPKQLVYIFPLLFALSIICMLLPSVRKQYFKIFFSILIILANSLILTLVATQTESAHRFYLFNYPLILMVLVVSFFSILTALQNIPVLGNKSFIGYLACIISIFFTSVSVGRSINQYMNNEGTQSFLPPSPLTFLMGRSSFQDVINRSRYNINPPCTELAHAIHLNSADPNERSIIWSLPMILEVGCYIMPKTPMMIELSGGFGKNWHRIVFGPAQQAKTELSAIHISYFYVDLAVGDPKRDKIINSSFIGCLAYSPLFEAHSLSENFSIAWQQRDKYLLVLGKNGAPLTHDFLKKWNAKIDLMEQPGLGNMKTICSNIRKQYQSVGERWPVHS